jgi:hypothetical protein
MTRMKNAGTIGYADGRFLAPMVGAGGRGAGDPRRRRHHFAISSLDMHA